MIDKLNSLLLLIVALTLGACASNPPRERVQVESNNLIVNLFGDDPKVLRERIIAGLAAVGPDGHLILDYSPIEDLPKPVEPGHGLPVPIEDLLQGLSKSDRAHIFLTRYAEPYPWIRDSSFGWQKEINGKFRVNVKSDGNQATKGHVGAFSAASIITLLNSCKDSSLDLPKLRKIALQEGMIVSNGAGVCVTNRLVSQRVADAKDETLFRDLGCNKVISSIDWQDWRKQGHPNGHIDMSVAFVSPNVAVIPKLDSDCKTKFETGWSGLKTQLNNAGIDTIEIPIGLGCIEKPPIVRTYSNMVILKDSIIVAKFLPPSIDMQSKYEKYNSQAVQILQEAMDNGKIPRRNIIQFPIANEIKGGSVHCMSLNVPGPLESCTQAHLDAVLQEKVNEGLALSNKNSPSSDFCTASADILATTGFIDKYLGNRTLQTLEDDDAIRISAETKSRIHAMVGILEVSRRKNCQ